MEKVKLFLQKWNELLTIPAALLLWSISGPLLRFFDPTSGIYDLGIFQKILFAIIALLIFHGFVRILMKLMWFVLDRHLDMDYAKEFEVHRNLTPYQKICVSTSVFFLLLFALVLLFAGI